MIDSEIKDDNYIYANLNENNYLAAIDWNSLLTIMETELDTAGDYLLKSDLIQLKGLCNQMDEVSFLPLDSTEISPMIARRNMQFYEIVNNVISSGKSEGIYSRKDLRAASGLYWYGNYFEIGDFLYLLKFDNKNWHEWRNTPIWLEVYGTGWREYGKGWRKDTKERSKVRNALSELESHTNNRLFFDQDDVAIIPLKVELGAVKDQVVESIKQQIEEINLLLNRKY
ncbi:hypothetical protein FGU46_01225 [Methanobacterium sp. CWC-01]|uniref:hypothetical protein n=1 Tax=Methanobacterium aridiramus TaxID=2584467 RepID=UPI002577023C|nr:hypothetical protein [Methanobacterium sp. CWC-01]WJI08809.1 hypothetical protein FGU46_01225 [Methanobacterium sp. CWC-01]